VTSEELAGGKLILDSPAEAVVRITISNPERRNALDHEILDTLAETLPRLDSGIENRCVLITGAPPVFSAGYDIGSIPEQTFERDAESLVAHPFHAAMEALSAHPWPTVAMINGHCLGGGLELAVTCDMRICAEGAKLGMPPAKLGLIYGHTGLRKFLDTVGLPRTKELFLTGRNVEASRAEEIGLVHEVFADGDLERAALDARQQKGDRGPEREPGPHPGPGGRAGRAARVLLRLRRLPRGHPGVRPEAAPALDGEMSAA
jgi:enoyl-CoA hydratase/carnithine racemase